jgi:hypothetical protein
MRKTLLIASSSLAAGALATALFLRPARLGIEKLPEPTYLPPAARQVLKGRMERHGGEMRELVMRIILMDDDGAARVAGAIYDEPTLARPLAGDELNGMLPERFFVLQDELKASAKRTVGALARGDHAAIGDELAALTKSCVVCHDAYLHTR